MADAVDIQSAHIYGHDGIKRYVEESLGATLVRIERQRRWRPVWRVFIEKEGVPKSVLFKADRVWAAHPYPLVHEYNILKVLADAGILIPHLYGMSADPEAIVMDWVEGGRDPGLVMEAMENLSVMTPDRWSASLSYMEMLADMHKIPPEKFLPTRLPMPVGPTEIALSHFERFYQQCVEEGITDPFMEFVAIWLRRNVPQDRSRVSFVSGDCGQFLSDGPVVTAVIDMEIGHLGDFHQDLACFRGRHPIENMGDLPALFRHYEKALGEPVDFRVIAYHTVAFMGIAYYGPLFALNKEREGGDWVESAVQCAMIGRRLLEAMAELAGVPLDTITLPEPRVTPMEDLALRKLSSEIRRVPLTEDFRDWQRGIIASIPDYLLGQMHYNVWSEAADLDEASEVLGQRPANLVEADATLAVFVKAAGPEQDAVLIRLFYRRLLRQCLIIAGDNPNHLSLCPMEPILGGE